MELLAAAAPEARKPPAPVDEEAALLDPDKPTSDAPSDASKSTGSAAAPCATIAACVAAVGAAVFDATTEQYAAAFVVTAFGAAASALSSVGQALSRALESSRDYPETFLLIVYLTNAGLCTLVYFLPPIVSSVKKMVRVVKRAVCQPAADADNLERRQAIALDDELADSGATELKLRRELRELSNKVTERSMMKEAGLADAASDESTTDEMRVRAIKRFLGEADEQQSSSPKSCLQDLLRSKFVYVSKRITLGLSGLALFYLDVSSDVRVCVLFFSTANVVWGTQAAILLGGQYVIIWHRSLGYLSNTFGADADETKLFRIYGLPFGVLALDLLMLLEPFGLLGPALACLPPRQRDVLLTFIPAYKSSRLVSEVAFESMPQVRICLHTH